jgi:hypothetical protein
MDRRGFVVLLGLLAGCATGTPGGGATGIDPNAVRDRDRRADAGREEVRLERLSRPARGNETGADPAPADAAAADGGDADGAADGGDDDGPRELSDRELRAEHRLSRANAKLAAVVAAFTDGYGTELTDVTAASVGFLRSQYDIRVALADAQGAYVDAEKAAANAEQRRRAAGMVACWQFLRSATETQVALVEGYEQLRAAAEAFDRNYAEGGATAADRLERLRTGAERSLEALDAASSVADAEAVGAISAAEYEGKVAQFAADVALYRALDEALRTFVEGSTWLRRANGWYYGDDRHVRNAKDAAAEARDALRSARRLLDAARADAGDDATATPVVSALSDLAAEKITEAEAILD